MHKVPESLNENIKNHVFVVRGFSLLLGKVIFLAFIRVISSIYENAKMVHLQYLGFAKYDSTH